MNDFFRDKQGDPLYLTGLQAHNSSTGTDMLDKAIRAVQLYGGNLLETPIYWNAVEPEMGKYDMGLVKDTIDRARAANLYLILLWFATSKNGHPNYAPEYIKLDPHTYRLAHGADGAPLPALSPHCEATLERDALAFEQVMAFLKAYDGDVGTVLAVQIENEMGLGGTDRDYSEIADADYQKPLPEALRDVELPDCGARSGDDTWRGHFGRHAHEAFCAWYHARYIGRIAERGRAVYDGVKLITNVMVGEGSYEEAGHCYNSGAAVGRVIPIWKKGAPALDLVCPDIYNQEQSVYARICSLYAREDNALFIPESSPMGESSAMNLLRAAAEYGAVGVCGFGAESALDNAGNLTEEAYPVMVSMRILQNLAPLLIRYRGTGRVHLFLQEEFATKQYLKLEKYHVVAHYLRGGDLRHGLGSCINLRLPENRRHLEARGRGILVQTGEDEFFLAGAGLALDFLTRPDPADENPYPHLSSRQANQLNFLSVEEGHFEGEKWVVDYLRNGDESNFSLYAHEGQVVRLRLNPNKGMDER